MYGPYIRAARERAGLSVPQAARAVGVTDDAIYKIERGANPAKLATLEKLAGAYGCLVGDLLPNSGGGAVTEMFEPIAAALMGLDQDEARDQILVLASQARLSVNAIIRRARRNDASVTMDTRNPDVNGDTPFRPNFHTGGSPLAPSETQKKAAPNVPATQKEVGEDR